MEANENHKWASQWPCWLSHQNNFCKWLQIFSTQLLWKSLGISRKWITDDKGTKNSPKNPGKKSLHIFLALQRASNLMLTHNLAKRALWWLNGISKLVTRSCVTHPYVVMSPCGNTRSAASSSAWSRGPAAPRSALQRPWACCRGNQRFC